jgi:hypothetical protein
MEDPVFVLFAPEIKSAAEIVLPVLIVAGMLADAQCSCAKSAITSPAICEEIQEPLKNSLRDETLKMPFLQTTNTSTGKYAHALIAAARS